MQFTEWAKRRQFRSYWVWTLIHQRVCWWKWRTILSFTATNHPRKAFQQIFECCSSLPASHEIRIEIDQRRRTRWKQNGNAISTHYVAIEENSKTFRNILCSNSSIFFNFNANIFFYSKLQIGQYPLSVENVLHQFTSFLSFFPLFYIIFLTLIKLTILILFLFKGIILNFFWFVPQPENSLTQFCQK